MKKVLITGGAGFIGSHLCNYYLSQNYFVHCMDNFSSGNHNNIKKYLNDKRFKVIEHDISDPLKIKNDYDYILNFACPASPKYYLANPLSTAKASVNGIQNILNFVIQNNSTFLHASTSEVYGDPFEHPQKESYYGNVNPIGSRSCYDEGKRVAEMFIFEYEKKYSLNAKIIRIFNTYGPNMHKDDGRVVSNFINQALNNDVITIYGDGTQTRSLCYINDLVQGISSYLSLNDKFLGPVNLGNPTELSINEIASLIIKLTNSSSKIEYFELPKDDPLKRRPDISLAHKKFGFSPSFSLEEGLLKTVKYFKSV